MAMSPYHDTANGHYGWGIMGGVKQVPSRFIAATVLYFSDIGIMHVSLREDIGVVLAY